MKILAFDVSNNVISVAISDGDEILSSIQDLTPSSQAEKLVPLIELTLREAKMSYKDIEYLAVTNGPGSFTGIRVGLACAKGILFDNNIKATAINNFEIYYYRAKQQVKIWEKIIILLNAYRGQLYVKIFDKTANEYEPLLLTYKQTIDLLWATNPENKIICAGSGLHIIYEDTRNIKNITFLPRFSKIKAIYVCRYIAENFNIRQPLPIEPLYIRPPDAKIKIL